MRRILWRGFSNWIIHMIYNGVSITFAICKIFFPRLYKGYDVFINTDKTPTEFANFLLEQRRYYNPLTFVTWHMEGTNNKAHLTFKPEV